MGKQPSILKIIIIDYTAFTAALFPVAMWVFYVLLLVMKEVRINDLTIPAVAAGVTLVSILLLTWRIRQISLMFEDGLAVPAVIRSVFFFRDRGRVEYTFTYNGQEYITGNALHKVKQTSALKAGDTVTVLLDRNDPRRTCIRELYQRNGK
jgi:Protein of unknown function (DUF3592)